MRFNHKIILRRLVGRSKAHSATPRITSTMTSSDDSNIESQVTVHVPETTDNPSSDDHSLSYLTPDTSLSSIDSVLHTPTSPKRGFLADIDWTTEISPATEASPPSTFKRVVKVPSLDSVREELPTDPYNPDTPTIRVIDENGKDVRGSLQDNGEWLHCVWVSCWDQTSDIDYSVPERNLLAYSSRVSGYCSIRHEMEELEEIQRIDPRANFIILRISPKALSVVAAVLMVNCKINLIPIWVAQLNIDDICHVVRECLRIHGGMARILVDYWTIHCPWKALLACVYVYEKDLAMKALANMFNDKFIGDPTGNYELQWVQENTTYRVPPGLLHSCWISLIMRSISETPLATGSEYFKAACIIHALHDPDGPNRIIRPPPEGEIVSISPEQYWKLVSVRFGKLWDARARNWQPRWKPDKFPSWSGL